MKAPPLRILLSLHPSAFILHPFLSAASKLDERADASARSAFGGEGRRVVVPGRAGDVEVRPGRRAGELREQERGCRGVGSPAVVLEVCDEALDTLFVVVGDGHAPCGSARAWGGGKGACAPLVVFAEEAGGVGAESDDDRACKRGEVNDARRAELFGVG